jgi:muconate cycloisomerase
LPLQAAKRVIFTCPFHGWTYTNPGKLLKVKSPEGAGYPEGFAKNGSHVRRLAGALAGHASLIVDANQAWNETTALRCLPILAELGIRLVEQPLPAWNLAGMARLRVRSTVPLMADECVFSAYDMLDVARAGAADPVSLKLVKHGGLLATRDVASVAEAAGISLYGGCLLESSIGAAHLQVFAGLRELAWGCEHFGPQIIIDDLVEKPLRFADFRIHLPAGSGLGVTLDQEKLRRYARG